MFQATITRPKLQTAVLKWFVSEEFSFEQETALANSGAGLTPANLFDIGLIVGKVLAAGATSAANAGNTGNGTLGSLTVQTGVQVGAYAVEFIAATKYNVYDPAGNLVGEGTTGVAFANQVGFTITAGGTAFVAGDGFTVTVALGSTKVVPLNLTATDGSQNPVGVVARQTTVSPSADTPVVLVERLSVLLSDGLIFPAGATTNQKTAIRNQLAALGLIVRDS